MKGSSVVFVAIVLATLCCGSFGRQFVTLTTDTDARTDEIIVDNGGIRTKTGIRLSALKPDLELLRGQWLHDGEKARPARIQFFENRKTSIQIVVKFAPKLFQDEYWQDDFLMIELLGDTDYDTTCIFYKNGAFYVVKGAIFVLVPDDEFIPVLPITGSILEPSPYIDIRYATLDTIAVALYQHEPFGFNFIEKLSNFFRVDLSLIFVEDLLVLPRETIGNYYDEIEKYYYQFNHILDGVHHNIVRFDRRNKLFYSKNNVPIDGSYFARTADFKWQSKLGFKVSHAVTDRWDPNPVELATK